MDEKTIDAAGTLVRTLYATINSHPAGTLPPALIGMEPAFAAAYAAGSWAVVAQLNRSDFNLTDHELAHLGCMIRDLLTARKAALL